MLKKLALAMTMIAVAITGTVAIAENQAKEDKPEVIKAEGEWGYTRCRDWDNLQTNTDNLAKNCGKYIAEDGVISRGKHKNKLWKETYPDVVTFRSHSDSKVKFESSGDKFIWMVEGADALRTKKISLSDLPGYLKRIGFKFVFTPDS